MYNYRQLIYLYAQNYATAYKVEADGGITGRPDLAVDNPTLTL